ncbi:hypothetical protein AAT19DRAFT_9252 [Rhodotorula toruloides]|uniref:Uncharacterized protein n=1 Tax=Rhodotorula toruloides TaxID=5286 RepID=A0A2T0AJL3_RHOTO|nr:hypothetical protein AAT19DRAFT_9252 [Rhodotorula toruloides]
MDSSSASSCNARSLAVESPSFARRAASKPLRRLATPDIIPCSARNADNADAPPPPAPSSSSAPSPPRAAPASAPNNASSASAIAASSSPSSSSSPINPSPTERVLGAECARSSSSVPYPSRSSPFRPSEVSYSSISSSSSSKSSSSSELE